MSAEEGVKVQGIVYCGCIYSVQEVGFCIYSVQEVGFCIYSVQEVGFSICKLGKCLYTE